MRLKSFRIQNFRNINDSGEVFFDNFLVIVGQNGSGKTSLLKSLHKFNIDDYGKYDKLRDFPRQRFNEFKGDEPVVTLTFDLDQIEKTQLEKKYNYKIKEIKVTKNYASQYTFEFIPNIDGDRLSTVKDYLMKLIPTFVYLDNTDFNINQIHLPTYFQRIKSRTLNPEDRIIQALFKLAKIDPEVIINLVKKKRNIEDDTRKRDFDELTKKLNGASINITDEFAHLFDQEEFSVDIKLDDDYLQIWITDVNGSKVALNQRSHGFRWLLSFYIMLTNEVKDYNNVFFLFDTPGMSLSTSAQRKLIKVLRKVSENYQLIYTTHSPFMIDTDHINSIRTLIWSKDKGTKISSIIWENDKDALNPLQAALGNSLSQSLFLEENNLIVRKQKCFISASIIDNVQPLKKLIEKLGFEVIDVSSLPLVFGLDFASLVKDQIKKSNFLIGVISITNPNPNIYFQIGYAEGIKKPVLLIVQDDGLIPQNLKNLVCIKSSVTNIEKIQYTLEQFLTQYKYPDRKIIKRITNDQKILLNVADYKNQLEKIRNDREGRSLELFFFNIFKSLGLIIAKDLKNEDIGVDFSLWIDSLDYNLENPILAEIKYGNLSEDQLIDAENNLTNYLEMTNSTLGLLLYLDWNGRIFRHSKFKRPLVLRFEANYFLNKISNMGLAQVILSERNRIAHLGEKIDG